MLPQMSSEEISQLTPLRAPEKHYGKLLLSLLGIGIVNGFIVISLYSLMTLGAPTGPGVLVLLVSINIFGITVPYFLVGASVIEWLFIGGAVAARGKFNVRKPIVFCFAVFILALTEFAFFAIPQRYQETAWDSQNPIVTGTQQYDFSKVVQINSDQRAKTGLSIVGNKIIWAEETKQQPPYPHNIWDVFSFDFSPQTGSGTITKLSDFTSPFSINLDTLSGGMVIFDGAVYWVQNNTLYTFDEASQKPESLQSGILSVFGGYNHQLLVWKGSSSGSDHVPYWYNLTTKQFASTGISFYEGTPSMQGQYLCRVESSGTIERYDFASNQTITFAANDNPLADEYYPQIVQCAGDEVVYVTRNYSSAEYVIYQASTQNRVFGQLIHATGINPTAVVDGNDLFYTTDQSGIASINLTTGATTTVVDGIAEWALSGNYLAYIKGNSQVYVQQVAVDPAGPITFAGDLAARVILQTPPKGGSTAIQTELYYPVGSSVYSNVTIATLASPAQAQAYFASTIAPEGSYTFQSKTVMHSGNRINITQCPCSNPAQSDFFSVAWVSGNTFIGIWAERPYDAAASSAIDAFLAEYPSSL
jgi:hypothetical protein